MKWDDIKKDFPSKWVVLEELDAYDKDNCHVVVDSSVINVFEQFIDAYRQYRELYRANPNREFLFANTEMAALSFENRSRIKRY